MQYWLTKNPSIDALELAFDLVDAPASQTYVERLFLVCGDLTARKCNKTYEAWKNRVFLKLHSAMLAKLRKGAVASRQ